MKKLLIVPLLLSACSTQTLPNRAVNAGIAAAISVPVCVSVPACVIGSFVAAEGVNALGNALAVQPRETRDH